MDIKDYLRNSELHFGDSIDRDGEMPLVATSGYNDIVWFYINEEQARDIVRHLNREFDLGLRG